MKTDDPRSDLEDDQPVPVIGVVGPCGSGKSTLVAGLKAKGIFIRHIAQEHSYVPALWTRLVHAEILIFLDASYLETMRRRSLNWTIEEYNEQHRRLAHARAHCDLYLFTDAMSPLQVQQAVIDYLNQRLGPARK